VGIPAISIPDMTMPAMSISDIPALAACAAPPVGITHVTPTVASASWRPSESESSVATSREIFMADGRPGAVF
jgi:hypothetical protein